ncbi:MAG: hypothetical protein J1G02_06310 [Clostridiales bacterium]|nr:hypothetical protein [Clostridiales bacterium]
MAEYRQNANWCEEDHPRDEYGKFTDGTGTDKLLQDEYIHKSVGAKTKNYDIQYGDKIVHLVEGTYLRNKQIIAGNGRKRKIDEIEGLVEKYRGSVADKWVKVKGIGTIDTEGKSEDVEIHWYEEPSVGKVKLKVKDE